MWDRQFDQATWNGQPFNILKTNQTGGQRLQVNELPYKDDPHVFVMGSAAKAVKIEAVFVGSTSLTDANQFLAMLESQPAGHLEHPYLGEMDLVYKTYGQEISTIKGLVKLALEFVQQGSEITIPTSTATNLAGLNAAVIEAARSQFINQVATASPSEIDLIKTEFSTALSKLQTITNTLQQPGIELAHIHRQIQDGFTSLTGLTLAPGTFADHVIGVLSSLTTQINGRDSSGQPVDPAKQTSGQLRLIEKNSETSFLKTLTTINAIELNRIVKQLAEINSASENELVLPGAQITQAAEEIQSLKNRMNDRITESTAAATFSSLELTDQLMAVNSVLIDQANTLETLAKNTKTIEVVTATPALVLAWINDCSRDRFHFLNKNDHPLFVTGSQQVPNE